MFQLLTSTNIIISEHATFFDAADSAVKNFEKNGAEFEELFDENNNTITSIVGYNNNTETAYHYFIKYVKS